MTALFFPHAQGVCSQSIFTTKMRHCVLLTLSLASAYSLGNGASPVQKVISMLQDMRAKGVQMKQEEQVSFAA